jgi:hypothetical protein
VAVRVVTVRAVAVLGLERGAKHGVVRRLLSADALEKAIKGGSEGLLGGGPCEDGLVQQGVVSSHHGRITTD